MYSSHWSEWSSFWWSRRAACQNRLKTRRCVCDGAWSSDLLLKQLVCCAACLKLSPVLISWLFTPWGRRRTPWARRHAGFRGLRTPVSASCICIWGLWPEANGSIYIIPLRTRCDTQQATLKSWRPPACLRVIITFTIIALFPCFDLSKMQCNAMQWKICTQKLTNTLSV